MRVRLTPDAEAALVQISTYIRRDDPARALNVVRQLREKARDIGNNPHLYAVLPRWSDRKVRQRVVGDYLIHYVILSDRISILDIRHGARDPDREP